MTASISATLSTQAIVTFWTDKVQMGLVQRTLIALADDRVKEPSDLVEFKADDLKAIFQNLRKPAPTVAYDGTPKMVAS